jgi:cytochrome c peroxidase
MHRSIGDLMRHASLADGMSALTTYPPYRRVDDLPDAERFMRYTDEQLYALAMYLYSLKPPPNPNRPSALSRHGEKIFQREGCTVCHTPPLYTNNKLTPALGFTIPDDHKRKYAILPVTFGTDPRLAMQTRKATGYYRVPSLRGVWYGGPFEHNGSVATLEYWFDRHACEITMFPLGLRVR